MWAVLKTACDWENPVKKEVIKDTSGFSNLLIVYNYY